MKDILYYILILDINHEFDGIVEDSAYKRGGTVKEQSTISEEEYNRRKPANDALVNTEYPKFFTILWQNCQAYAKSMYDTEESGL